MYTPPRLEQFLECGAVLIGNETGTHSKTKVRASVVKLRREGGHGIHSFFGVFAATGF